MRSTRPIEKKEFSGAGRSTLRIWNTPGDGETLDKDRSRYIDHERWEARRLDGALAERRRKVERAIVAMVDILKNDRSIRKVIVFGSAARVDTTDPGDIDLAVEGLESHRYLDIWLKLEAVAEGVSFDLVDLADASEMLRGKVLEEGVICFERG